MTEPAPEMLDALPPEETPKTPSGTSPPEVSPVIRIGILLSGKGSNFKAIAQAIDARELTHAKIAIVISNKVDALGLAYAQDAGFPIFFISPAGYETVEAYDQRVLEQLRSARVDLVVLAGYNKILSPVLLEAYPETILNIHPSLLPAYGGAGMVGLKVHQAVIAAGELESGCTVHRVTAAVDQGPILGQIRVPVHAGDTPESLAERVLEQEHLLYPGIIQAEVNALLQGLQAPPAEDTIQSAHETIPQQTIQGVLHEVS